LRATVDPNPGLARWNRRDNHRSRRRRSASAFTTASRTNAAAANDNGRDTIFRFVGMLLFPFHCVADRASGVWQWTAARSAPRPALPRLPLRQRNCHCPVDTRPGSRSQVNGMFLRSDQSFAGIFGVRHAYRRQQRGCSNKSFPIIPLSVISVDDVFNRNRIANHPFTCISSFLTSTMQKS
jgi:hypothetical protein